MKSLILILTICLWNNSCTYKDDTQSYETTVTVLDMDGKPVKRRKVTVFTGFTEFTGNTLGFNSVETSEITDINGRVVLKYNLSLTDAGIEYAMITAEDDVLFKSTNVVTHPFYKSPETLKTSETIKMDSLVPFRVRFKTNRDDVKAFSVVINNDNATGKAVIKKVFMRTAFSATTPRIDTIINTMVYSKTNFMMNNSMDFKNQPSSISKGIILVTNLDNRNAIYLQEF